MNYIQIPVPDFSFSEAVRQRARKIIHDRLGETNITHGYTNQNELTRSQIQSTFYELNANEDRLTFISEILAHVFEVKLNFSARFTVQNDLFFSGIQRFTDLQYFLYNLLSTIHGVQMNGEAFSDAEIAELTRKIDAVIILLDKLQVGQEVIFDEIADLEADFKSLKTDFIAGKKKWYQRLLGIIVSYSGEKGGDVLFEKLKPLLKEFFSKALPHFIDKL